GVQITLRANVELPAEFQAVADFGACGVGLFRSEFLLSRPGLMSSEDDQYEVYKALVEAAGEYGAIVRLFDVGGEFGPDLKERERNPALACARFVSTCDTSRSCGRRCARYCVRLPRVL